MVKFEASKGDLSRFAKRANRSVQKMRFIFRETVAKLHSPTTVAADPQVASEPPLRRAFLEGAGADVLQQAKACFPELSWRLRSVAEAKYAALKQEQAEKSPSPEIALKPPKPWVDTLRDTDCLVIWKEREEVSAPFDSPPSARPAAYVMWRAPFPSTAAPGSFSLAALCLVLRPLDKRDRLMEVRGGKGLSCFAAPSLTSPVKSIKTMQVGVVGSSSVALAERAEHERVVALIAPPPSGAELEALVAQGIEAECGLAPAQFILNSQRVATDIFEIALVSQASGVKTTAYGDAKEALDLMKTGNNGAEAGYFGFARPQSFEHVKGETLSLEVHERLSETPDQEALERFADLKANDRIVIGAPERAIRPFAQHFGPKTAQRPEDLTIQAAEKIWPIFSKIDLLLSWPDVEAVEWLTSNLGATKKAIERLPLAAPLMLSLSDSHHPAFAVHRVAVKDGGATYAAAEEIDAFSSEKRALLQSEGAKLRPSIRKLQTAPRMARFSKIEIGRQFGPLSQARVLVLGREDSADALTGNPEGLEDLAIVKAALAAHPTARVLFMPAGKSTIDPATSKAIKAISSRVQLVDSPVGIGEFAHLVEAVHTIDSSLGPFVIAHGLPLVVYGRPHYAGLGLTQDLGSDGAKRPLLVKEALHPDAYVGWYFQECALFCDPLDGGKLDPETYAQEWSPYLGELSDATAERILARALKWGASLEDVRQLLDALISHAKVGHAQRLIDALAPDLVASNIPLTRDISAFLARNGNWRAAVFWTFHIWHAHGASSLDKIAEQLIVARQSLNSLPELSEFAIYVLSVFRSLPGAMIEQLATAFANKRYFKTALILFESCQRSNATIAVTARCHIGLGDVAKSQALINQLALKPDQQTVVEGLRLALLERQEDQAALIRIYEANVKKASTDFAQKLKLATLYRNSGRYAQAIDLLLPLVRSIHGHAAVRLLAEIYIAQMDIPNAQGLLTAQLQIMPTDAKAWRLMAEVHSFKNDLESACTCLLESLKLFPLDIGACAQLGEWEAELAKTRPEVQGRWSGAFDAYLNDPEHPTVDTLLMQGRARMQEHDFEVMKANCLKAMTLFPKDSRSHAWYAHAIAWEVNKKTPDMQKDIRRHFEIALVRDADDSPWAILDAIRSFAKAGDIASIHDFVKAYKFALYTGDRERLTVSRYSAALATGDFAEAFNAMRSFARTKVLRRNALFFQLALSVEDIAPTQSVLLLSEGGVGDELRYSTLYPQLVKQFKNAVVTVDERLLTLFERSFPMVERFLPLPRYHRKRLSEADLADIGDLPDRELAPFANNAVWKVALEGRTVLPVVCALADLRKTPEDFEAGRAVRLRPRPDLVEAWRERLAPYADKLIVGATWTSMIRDYQRSENYLTHEEIGPIFRTENAVFVNCQYEDVSEELLWLREHLGVEVLDFPDLDKRDDFENLAALLVNMDLFIGTGTATTEFAALLGLPTLFASPTALNTYRNPIGTEIDHYFPNMQIINPVPHWDRQSMIERLQAHITAMATYKRHPLYPRSK